MIETAENLRREFGITRAEQDELALASHRKAAAAAASGLFDEELLPVTVFGRRGERLVVDADEHVRRDASLEALARLKPILGRTDPDATVTAGNASGQNDAAATGARILATLAHELQRRGGGLALETMCIGGGQGLAAVFEGVQ